MNGKQPDWVKRSARKEMNRFVLAGMLSLMLLISGCGFRMDTEETIRETDPPSESNAGDEMENNMDESMPEESAALRMTIENSPVQVTWEDNESVTALRELARKEPIQIHMSMYGGFEQVGPIGTSLPTDDAETTTSAGDIVLYSGNQLVVFYGSNFWAYTRLGRITDKTAEDLSELLGNGDVTITIQTD